LALAGTALALAGPVVGGAVLDGGGVAVALPQATSNSVKQRAALKNRLGEVILLLHVDWRPSTGLHGPE